MRYGEPSSVLVQKKKKKATGLSGDPEQKAELGHSLHLLSRREGERERGYHRRDRDRIISERDGEKRE